MLDNQENKNTDFTAIEEVVEIEQEEKKGLFHKIFRKKTEEPVSPQTKIRRINADPEKGLTSKQAQDRTNKGYVNTAIKKYSKSYKSIFKENICTSFNLLCLLSAIMLLLAKAPLSQFFFVAIFLCNIIIGIFQEIRAKKKIDKLSLITSPVANVIRDGFRQEIPVNQIVVDDILLLSVGQQIPVDCIALDGNAEANEALLTGESVPIKKEKGDPLYAGSFISSGKVAVRVDKVGSDTYISKLTARAKMYKRPNSEILNTIYAFIKAIGVIICIVTVFMFISNYKYFNGDFSALWKTGFFKTLLGNEEMTIPLRETIKYTASVVIGMIPSGLILLTTVALSVGMIRLAKYNTLVQDMYSLEMLARVNVLCLDKTGTITDGRMKVSDCIALNNPTEFAIEDIMGSMLASLSDNNQTSIALYEKFGHSSALQPITTVPFSSARKLSAVTFNEVGTFVMGAPEFVLKPMPARIDKLVKQYAQMGLRVLMVAHSPTQIQENKIPSTLKGVALITLADNIRPDAIETIKWFKENDVAVKVISGDNPVTVSEVARRAGVQNASQFISLEGLSKIEVENAANVYTVFGRVTPEQKAILIRALKKSGNTVAMTGDGVNDILAMKEADCAVSVASGSEAARNVSNLVLQDNNFGSMPHIVNEGRRVINNVKNASSLYIMKTLLIFFLAVTCILFGSRYFFETNNMMMFEMFISAIPSFVLSLQPNTNRVRGKFATYVLSRSLPGALTMWIGIMALYLVQQSSYGSEFGLVLEYQNKYYDAPVYQALLMLILTGTGLIMLFQICRPLNLLRGSLWVLSLGLCILVLGVDSLSNIVFTDWVTVAKSFTTNQILLLVVIIQACIPISTALIRVCDMMNPVEKD